MQHLLQKYQDHVVDEQTQEMINQPVKDTTGFDEGHEAFLKDLIQKLEDGILDPYRSQTLYNPVIYNKLTDVQQEKADLTGVNLMSLIRQVQQLWKLDQKSTFQIQNLVESIFEKKSRFEAEYGDVYVI